MLAAALPRSARLIVVALSDAFQTRPVIMLGRKLNPAIETVVRTHSEAEALYLAESGVGLAVMGEREIAVGMSDFALQRLGVGAREARSTVDRLRGGKSARSAIGQTRPPACRSPSGTLDGRVWGLAERPAGAAGSKSGR